MLHGKWALWSNLHLPGPAWGMFQCTQHHPGVSLVPGMEGHLQLTCTRKPRLCPGCRYSCWHIRNSQEFNFCDHRGAWRVGVSGLCCGAAWRMCPQASGLVVPHGQEPLVAHTLVPTHHVHHLAGPWDWPERTFSWLPWSGRCVESCMRKKEREKATSDRDTSDLHTRSQDQSLVEIS